ncbi:DUF6916 family protein [Deinococcus cellulosilyticus]|uniref:DUF6916 domain-containing protein n=1 Tax=Deinococcus cellulosilyticus (strain DSM 18568 / NBRC 106333 / KACC 11606 / 5516J-15) TaxID=1223518 RepID=A0A511N2L6_DEIC1|nr:hypothetical protein [Deinococcus cellulosilyticus]GEM47082.1 hypothetical protein DC3_27170 [Deinococcus cellulosilyticus NBRC 106333 = KACC 11606]
MTEMLRTLTIDHFKPLIGETFHVQVNPQEAFEVQLAEANLLGGDVLPTSGRRPYSLIFVDSRKRLVPQAIFKVTHPAVGELDIFMVPLQPDARGTVFEVIFT